MIFFPLLLPNPKSFFIVTDESLVVPYFLLLCKGTKRGFTFLCLNLPVSQR